MSGTGIVLNDDDISVTEEVGAGSAVHQDAQLNRIEVIVEQIAQAVDGVIIDGTQVDELGGDSTYYNNGNPDGVFVKGITPLVRPNGGNSEAGFLIGQGENHGVYTLNMLNKLEEKGNTDSLVPDGSKVVSLTVVPAALMVTMGVATLSFLPTAFSTMTT